MRKPGHEPVSENRFGFWGFHDALRCVLRVRTYVRQLRSHQQQAPRNAIAMDTRIAARQEGRVDLMGTRQTSAVASAQHYTGL